MRKRERSLCSLGLHIPQRNRDDSNRSCWHTYKQKEGDKNKETPKSRQKWTNQHQRFSDCGFTTQHSNMRMGTSEWKRKIFCCATKSMAILQIRSRRPILVQTGTILVILRNGMHDHDKHAAIDEIVRPSEIIGWINLAWNEANEFQSPSLEETARLGTRRRSLNHRQSQSIC